MFERITIKVHNKHSIENPIDLGMLLEAMLFYKKVMIVATQGILKQLITSFGIENFEELIDRKILEIQYTETMCGIHTKTPPVGPQIHSPVILTSPQHTFFDEITKICIQIIGKEGKGRRTARRLAKKILVVNHDNSLVDSTRQLLLDNTQISPSIFKFLNRLVPEYNDYDSFRFITRQVENGLIVDTNLNFDYLNSYYHKRIPPSHSSLSSAYLLSILFDFETDLYHASRNLSEISTSQLSNDLFASRFYHLFTRCSKSAISKDMFQDFIFSDHKNIREFFNSGKIPLKEILQAIYNADKFKDWLVGKDIESNLLREYHQEITKGSIIDKLPSKTIRWSIFSGAGILTGLTLDPLAGTLTGLGLSMVDSFLIDKVFTGWKPNQFVEEYLLGLIPYNNRG